MSESECNPMTDESFNRSLKVSNNKVEEYSTPSASDRLIIKFIGLR
jgi:hypothetical protein